MFKQENPPPGLVIQLWIPLAEKPTRLSRNRERIGLDTIHHFTQSVATMVRQEPARVVQSLTRHRDEVVNSEGYTPGRPEVTARYVHNFAISPLEVIALDSYSKNEAQFKFWVDVMMGGIESVTLLVSSINSLRGNLGETLSKALKREKQLFDIHRPEERQQELFAEYASEATIGEAYLRQDQSGFTLLDYELERIHKESTQPRSLQPYKYLGAQLARDVYKIVYPLSEIK